jgi:hypothetical protein
MPIGYTKYHDPWQDADSATGGGDETTPLVAAALDHLEAGILAAADGVDGHDTDIAGIDSDIASLTGEVLSITADIASLSAEVESLTSGTASVTPIKLTTPQVSVTANAGNSFWTVTGLTDWDFGHWEFLKDVDGKIYGQVLVPDGVTAATIRLAIAANATSGVTRLGIGSLTAADGETINPAALIDATKQDITVPGTAYLRKDVTFSLTGLAGKDLLILEIFHEGSHANDTLAVNTILLGAWLEPA